jgi:cytochrome c556
MDEIRINFKEMNSELEKFNNAIKEFEPYSKNFIKNTIKKLDSKFNADFTKSLKKLLENMTDTKAPELVKDAKDFYSSVKGLSYTFDELDKDIAKKFENTA